MPKYNAHERFWSRVPVPRADSDCMNWTGSSSAGRGTLWWNGKMKRAYQVMWEIMNGPQPKGKVVRHACDNGLCVRPDHLLIGTPKDNSQDMLARGRAPSGNPIPRETIEAIIMDRQAGMSYAKVAERNGVSAATAWRYTQPNHKPDHAPFTLET